MASETGSGLAGLYPQKRALEVRSRGPGCRGQYGPKPEHRGNRGKGRLDSRASAPGAFPGVHLDDGLGAHRQNQNKPRSEHDGYVHNDSN